MQLRSITSVLVGLVSAATPLALVAQGSGAAQSAPGHTTRNFAITRDGVLYVNVGSPSNSCQEKDRGQAVAGRNPCTELDTRAGIWKFDARKKGQMPSAANHFARGIRNAVGIAINP